MARHRRERIAAAEVVAELGPLLLLAGDDGGGDDGLGGEIAADLGARVGVLVDRLGDDVARAGEGRFSVRNLLRGVDVGGGGLLGGRVGLLGEQGHGEGLKPAFAGDHGARAALGAERQIDVLECGNRLGLIDAGGQLVGEQPALLQRFEDRAASGVQLGETREIVAHRGDLHLVELPRGLLAVAGDERHRGAALDQPGDRLHLRLANPQRLGNVCRVIHLHCNAKCFRFPRPSRSLKTVRV